MKTKTKVLLGIFLIILVGTVYWSSTDQELFRGSLKKPAAPKQQAQQRQRQQQRQQRQTPPPSPPQTVDAQVGFSNHLSTQEILPQRNRESTPLAGFTVSSDGQHPAVLNRITFQYRETSSANDGTPTVGMLRLYRGEQEINDIGITNREGQDISRRNDNGRVLADETSITVSFTGSADQNLSASETRTYELRADVWGIDSNDTLSISLGDQSRVIQYQPVAASVSESNHLPAIETVYSTEETVRAIGGFQVSRDPSWSDAVIGHVIFDIRARSTPRASQFRLIRKDGANDIDVTDKVSITDLANNDLESNIMAVLDGTGIQVVFTDEDENTLDVNINETSALYELRALLALDPGDNLEMRIAFNGGENLPYTRRVFSPPPAAVHFDSILPSEETVSGIEQEIPIIAFRVSAGAEDAVLNRVSIHFERDEMGTLAWGILEAYKNNNRMDLYYPQSLVKVFFGDSPVEYANRSMPSETDIVLEFQDAERVIPAGTIRHYKIIIGLEGDPGTHFSASLQGVEGPGTRTIRVR